MYKTFREFRDSDINLVKDQEIPNMVYIEIKELWDKIECVSETDKQMLYIDFIGTLSSIQFNPYSSKEGLQHLVAVTLNKAFYPHKLGIKIPSEIVFKPTYKTVKDIVDEKIKHDFPDNIKWEELKKVAELDMNKVVGEAVENIAELEKQNQKSKEQTINEMMYFLISKLGYTYSDLQKLKIKEFTMTFDLALKLMERSYEAGQNNMREQIMKDMNDKYGSRG